MINPTSKKGYAHVKSTDMRSIIESIAGEGSYIAGKDECLEVEVDANNTIKIRSGVLIHHGNISIVPAGTYDSVQYNNGSQGQKRIDLLVARHTKNTETGVETDEWAVIQGAPAKSDPVAPSYTQGNMQEGDIVDECPVAEIELDGINVVDIRKLPPVLLSSDKAIESFKEKFRGGLSDSVLISKGATSTLSVPFPGIASVPTNVITADAKPFTVVASAYTSSGIPAEVAVSNVTHSGFDAIVTNWGEQAYFRVYWLAIFA